MGKTFQSITINTPADKVWDAISDFSDMSWSTNVITDLRVVGDAGGKEPGAGRVLNNAFHETLISIDNEQRTFSYSIDDGPSPISKDEVTGYVGTVKVQAAADGNGTLVEWSSKWESRDEAAYEFCHGIYLALLDDMKQSLE